MSAVVKYELNSSLEIRFRSGNLFFFIDIFKEISKKALVIQK